jgi:hypothetical protein
MYLLGNDDHIVPQLFLINPYIAFMGGSHCVDHRPILRPDSKPTPHVMTRIYP